MNENKCPRCGAQEGACFCYRSPKEATEVRAELATDALLGVPPKPLPQVELPIVESTGVILCQRVADIHAQPDDGRPAQSFLLAQSIAGSMRLILYAQDGRALSCDLAPIVNTMVGVMLGSPQDQPDLIKMVTETVQ